jgi:hypothetical protein
MTGAAVLTLAVCQAVEALCPGGAAALAECLHSGVLVADGNTVGFRHELARRATADQIPDYLRGELHKQALKVLAEPPTDPNRLAALAFHADQAGDTDTVIRYGPAAAERAYALGANREAAELYALVLRHANTIPDEQKVTWVEQHAFSSYLSGQAEASARSFRAAITLRHTLGDRLAEGDLLRWLSRLLFPLGRTAEAIQAGRASLRLLEDTGRCPQLAWSLINMAEQAAFGYDPAAADYAARAITLGGQLGEPAMVIRARCCAALATVLRTDTGWDELEAGWCDAVAMDGLAELAGTIGAFICWIAALHRDLDRAERRIAEAAPFCREQDLAGFESLVIGADALLGLNRGDWVRAASRAEDVLTGPALSPLSRFLPLITLALIAARQARPVGSLLDEALAAAEPDDFFRSGAVWAARAEVAWLAGDDDTARREAHADPWLVGHLRRWCIWPAVTHHSQSSATRSPPTTVRSAGTGRPRSTRGRAWGARMTPPSLNSAATSAPCKPRWGPSARWAPARPAVPSNVWPNCAVATQTYAAKTPSPTHTDSQSANATYSNSLPPATPTARSPPHCASAPRPPTPTCAPRWPNSVCTTAPRPPPTPTINPRPRGKARSRTSTPNPPNPLGLTPYSASVACTASI